MTVWAKRTHSPARRDAEALPRVCVYTKWRRRRMEIECLEHVLGKRTLGPKYVRPLAPRALPKLLFVKLRDNNYLLLWQKWPLSNNNYFWIFCCFKKNFLGDGQNYLWKLVWKLYLVLNFKGSVKICQWSHKVKWICNYIAKNLNYNIVAHKL